MVRGQFTTCLHYMGKLVEGVGGVVMAWAPDAGCRNGEREVTQSGQCGRACTAEGAGMQASFKGLAERLRASRCPAGWITKRSLRAGSFGLELGEVPG